MKNHHDLPGFTLTRRQVLAATSAAIGSAAVGRFGFTRLAEASLPPASGRAFIFCYFPGGWDQLLFLDPRDPRDFPDSERARTNIETRYNDLEGFSGFSSQLVRPRDPSSPLVFGPAAAKPNDARKITDFADRMAIVRGINMNTLGHEVGYRYFLTTKFPSGNAARGTNIATEIVGQMVPRRPLPNLSLRVESYNDRHPGSASAIRVDSINDLLLLLRPSSYQERDVVEDALVDYGQRVGPCTAEVADRRGLYTAMRRARSQADQIVRERLASTFEFVTATTPEAMELRTRYNFALGDAGSTGARACAAAQAIKSGMTQVVSVTIGVGTDTHFVGNQGHAPLLYQGISALVAMLSDLERTPHPQGGNFLDHTTVMCFSEFSRTPLFNNFNGRDHHISNSCLLVGAGIRGHTVVGATSNVGMGPMRWDIRNNRPSDTGEQILPEHIAATLLASAGLDYYVTRVEPLRAVLRT
jgi:uncharacterized protein (DUF1501 family)